MRCLLSIVLQFDIKTSGKPTLVLFWQKLAKGDYAIYEQISELAVHYAGKLNFLGINTDAEIEEAVSFIKRQGTVYEKVTYRSDFDVAYDHGKALTNAFREAAGLSALGSSNVFLVDAHGKIVWRERFSQSLHVLKSPVHSKPIGYLAEQVRRIANGEELFKVGNRPEEAGEEEGIAAEGGADLFDF